MIFKELAMETLTSRLEVNEADLQAALDTIDPNATADAEEAIDAIDTLRERIEDLEGEQGNQLILDFRDFLLSADLSVIEALGISRILETYYLAKLVNAVPTDVWNTEIPDTEDELHVSRFDDPIAYWDTRGKAISVFASSNASRPERTVAMFKIPNLDEDYLTDESTEVAGHGLDESASIKARLCGCFLRVGEGLSGKTFIVCNKKQKSIIKTALDFHIVARGFLTSRPQKLTTIAGTESIATYVEARRANSQMSEPMDILSEINSRETILEKFLTTYHALENYMLRVKFASMQNGMSDRTFRIRDLKVLGAVSDEKELAHLKQLFDMLWEKSICGSQLITFASGCLANFCIEPAFNQAGLDEFLKKLGLTTRSGIPKPLLNEQNLKSHLPELIYKVRCSIVHHKATEFHISNRTLEDATLQKLHTTLLIPVMARVAYGLPLVSADNPLRYNEKHLELY